MKIEKQQLEQWILKGNKTLRYGYTTGSCATAATKASMQMLLGGKGLNYVKLMTPKGFELELEVEDICMTKEFVSCCITKDSGDDPDVTQGMKIYALVSRAKHGMITLEGGIGIGRVTKSGLKVPIGEAAINPGPKGTILKEANEICKHYGYKDGIDILIYAPLGEEIAKKTFNPRLGIMGGISILGTTGIVEPMSEAAIIETIYTEMRVLKANGHKNLLVCPGNYGVNFIQHYLGIEVPELVKCSNFIGEMLDYAVYLGFESVVLIGHMGKLVKLAAGIMNTHSKYADGRVEVICTHAALNGASKELLEALWQSITTDEAVSLLKEAHMDACVIGSIMKKMEEHITYRVKSQVPVKVIMFSDTHGFLGAFEGVEELVKKIKEGNVK
ncbi:MAG: cobalt-precorrin-5B (C(1))-methyltransferase CbiD [Cellulosilyticaceae bacterium]